MVVTMCATEGFTPISAAIGGLILSIAVTLLFWVTGHITGISSILEGLLYGRNLSTNWRLSWMAGFVGAVLLLNSEMPELLDQGSMRSPNWIYVVSGFCIGLGSRVASGCTSGHGLCGTALLSRRSVTATLVFLCTAFLTATSMSLNGKAEEFQAQPFDKFWDVPLENSRNISTALVVLISLISVKSFFSKKGMAFLVNSVFTYRCRILGVYLWRIVRYRTSSRRYGQTPENCSLRYFRAMLGPVTDGCTWSRSTAFPSRTTTGNQMHKEIEDYSVWKTTQRNCFR